VENLFSILIILILFLSRCDEKNNLEISDYVDCWEVTASKEIARKLVTSIINQTIDLGKNHFIGHKEELLMKYK
jgi:hypothetical protein